MITLSTEQIKEIAEQLEIGFTCFLDKSTNELIFLAGDEFEFLDAEDDAWAEERKKIDDNPDDYYEIEKMDSTDSYAVMQDFVYTVDSEKLSEDLVNALNHDKPFKQFKYVIDDSGEYRQKWFDFKSMKMQHWVKSEIDLINGNEEPE